MDGEEERLVETNDRGRRIVGPPGGGPLLRIFGLAALNGCGDVGSAHLVCIRSPSLVPIDRHLASPS